MVKRSVEIFQNKVYARMRRKAKGRGGCGLLHEVVKVQVSANPYRVILHLKCGHQLLRKAYRKIPRHARCKMCSQ